ncbi:ABC transporter ATP-binding protein [Jiangella muralis]|uniref:ABC transporter ATP-binding protein n=1 Tax=Jiangella muralis TaxID=702383 RepID=UPI00069DC6E9|nr:ABC transporter ATP-binding protein [Jiangella muralis]
MLTIRDLTIHVGNNQIVGIDELDIERGARLGLVGESGSGKTMTAMSLVGLQHRDCRVTGSVQFDGRELIGCGEKDLARIRGSDVGMIFQDPLRALNPTMRVGRQIGEAIRLHARTSRAQLRARVHDLMTQVRLPDPDRLARCYPHQLSGGQQQRVLIAMAIACDPKLLIADEPTTALDVTVQKEILDLLVRLSSEKQMAMLFVSHDLGVVRAVSEQVAVLYSGRLVEVGPSDAVIGDPRHRYTEALVAANPGLISSDETDVLIGQPLPTITGSVPAPGAAPSGCAFRNRCAYATDACEAVPPMKNVDSERRFTCWNPSVDVKAGSHGTR